MKSVREVKVIWGFLYLEETHTDKVTHDPGSKVTSNKDVSPDIIKVSEDL